MDDSPRLSDFWLNEVMSPWDIYGHGVTRILAHLKTPYQEMHIVESGSWGKSLVLDGKWQSSVGDEFLYHEPLVHPAMLAHGDPRCVLVLGGGEGATVREVLRWKSVERVVMVDIDGEVVEACRLHLEEMHQGALDDPRVELVIDNAVNWLENGSHRFDIVISDLSDPIEEGPAFPLFTIEMMRRIENVLEERGVFVLQAGPTDPLDLHLFARTVNTLQAVFPHVLPYASSIPTYATAQGFALASRLPLDSRSLIDRTDECLAGKTHGGFRALDAQAMTGIFGLPLNVRRAIERERGNIYTLERPPKAFGRGHATGES